MYTCKCTLGCDIGFLESNYLNLGPFFNKFPFKKNIVTQKDLIKSVAVDDVSTATKNSDTDIGVQGLP